MKIRLLTGRATDEGREAWSPGDVLTVGQDVDKDEATRMLDSGQAEPVVEKRAGQRETRAG